MSEFSQLKPIEECLQRSVCLSFCTGVFIRITWCIA